MADDPAQPHLLVVFDLALEVPDTLTEVDVIEIDHLLALPAEVVPDLVIEKNAKTAKTKKMERIVIRGLELQRKIQTMAIWTYDLQTLHKVYNPWSFNKIPEKADLLKGDAGITMKKDFV